LTKETPDCPAQIKIADFGLAKMGELKFSVEDKLLMNSPQCNDACFDGWNASISCSRGGHAEQAESGIRECR
jgi:hypothetical protein